MKLGSEAHLEKYSRSYGLPKDSFSTAKTDASETNQAKQAKQSKAKQAKQPTQTKQWTNKQTHRNKQINQKKVLTFFCSIQYPNVRPRCPAFDSLSFFCRSLLLATQGAQRYFDIDTHLRSAKVPVEVRLERPVFQGLPVVFFAFS